MQKLEAANRMSAYILLGSIEADILQHEMETKTEGCRANILPLGSEITMNRHQTLIMCV